MKRIRADDLHKEWMDNPAYRREYEALEEEFALVATLIQARARAGLTQAQVARRMKTTQTGVARLEGGARKAVDPHAGKLRRRDRPSAGD